MLNKDNQNVTYTDKGFKEVVVNFVQIEALCSKCRTTFFSKMKLHHHLKSGCQEVTSSSFPTEQASFIFIIAFRAVHQLFGSRFSFKG